jgi:predicted secreted Zn-dependent protease
VEEQAGAAGEWVGEQAGAAADWVGEQAGAASEWVSEQVGAAGAAVGSAVEAATEVASGVWDEAQSLSEDLRQRYAKELEVLNEVVGSMGKPGFITSFPLILSALDDLLGKLGKGALGANLGAEAEPLQTPPTNTKSYTKITPKSGSYTVSGTLSEVGEKLAARGHAGSVQPKYTKTYTEIDTGTEKVVLAQIELDLTKTMPKWAEYDKQCAPIKAEWDRVYAELDAHENKHMADDNRIFANLHTKLIGLSNEKAGERIDAATDESDQASDAFHATDAGSKQPTVKHVTCGGLEKVP